MPTLEELYAKRKVFIDYNVPIPEDLANEIASAEAETFKEVNEAFSRYVPYKLPFHNSPNSIIVAIEYKDRVASRIYSSKLENNVIDLSEMSSLQIEPREDEDVSTFEEYDNDNDEVAARRGSIPFAVRFADGKTFQYQDAIDTMVESLKYMGLDRASKFRGETFKGFPLIGTEKRTTLGKNGRQHKWQRYVDGWWIYSNMANDRKIKCIEGVARMLGIELEIDLLDDNDGDYIPYNRPKGKRALFSLDGSEPLNKRQAVFETVNKFVQENPDATFNDIVEWFPSEIQGSYGVVASEEEYQRRITKGQDADNRYFIDKPLKDSQGRTFYVCHQWGDNFSRFQKHVANTLGWNIEEINN